MRPQEFILSRRVNRQLHYEIVRHSLSQAYAVNVRMTENGPIYDGADSMVRYDLRGKDREVSPSPRAAYRIRVWPKKI